MGTSGASLNAQRLVQTIQIYATVHACRRRTRTHACVRPTRIGACMLCTCEHAHITIHKHVLIPTCIFMYINASNSMHGSGDQSKLDLSCPWLYISSGSHADEVRRCWKCREPGAR